MRKISPPSTHTYQRIRTSTSIHSIDHSTWHSYNHTTLNTSTPRTNSFKRNFLYLLMSILFWFFFKVSETSEMIGSRCFNSVLKRSTSSSCYKSASRNHNNLIAKQTPTKRFLEPATSAIQTIGNDKRTMATAAKPTLTLDSLNPNVIKMEYAVRGPLVIRAGEIEKEIKQVYKPHLHSGNWIHLNCRNFIVQYCYFGHICRSGGRCGGVSVCQLEHKFELGSSVAYCKIRS